MRDPLRCGPGAGRVKSPWMVEPSQSWIRAHSGVGERADSSWYEDPTLERMREPTLWGGRALLFSEDVLEEAISEWQQNAGIGIMQKRA